MKKLIVLFFILLNISSFSQESEKSTLFSNFNMEFLGGINYTTITGPSLIIEGKTSLTSHFNLKLSIGYSMIYKNDFHNVKGYEFLNFGNIQQYETYSYNINKIEYDMIPISIGFEYIFGHDKLLPYCFLETGYNYYSAKAIASSRMYTSNYYGRYDEIPSDYQNGSSLVISEDKSYRLGLGIGAQYQLSQKINLDIRYLYQYNSNIINTHQVLIGFSY